MSRAQFLKGTHLIVDGREVVLQSMTIPGRWQAQATANGEFLYFDHSELLSLYLQSRCRFKVDPQQLNAAVRTPAKYHFDDLPQHIKDEAKIKRGYVKYIENTIGFQATQSLMEKTAKEYWQKVKWPNDGPPSRSSLWRWISAYRLSGNDIRAVAPKVAMRGNRESKVNAALQELVDRAVDTIYLTTQRQTYQDTLDHAIVLVTRENKQRLSDDQLPLPTMRLIKRTITAIPAYDRYAARHGRQAADRMYRAVLKKKPAMMPLERVEFDHTRLDVFVIDEETLLPLGRPTFALCIDAGSRALNGYDLSFDPPSYMTVARCLRHAILPKQPSQAATNPWPMYGIMDTLVVDNALENHGHALEAMALELGIEIQYTPRMKPWYKGMIERAIGSANRGVAHVLPGTTFSNILQKEEYDPLKHATVTLKKLHEIIEVWICDYYHQRPHRCLKDTPAHAWSIGTAGMEIPIPLDASDFTAQLGEIETRQLTHKGIEINSMFYNSLDAKALRCEFGDNINVTVRWHSDDLSFIHVRVSESEPYVRLPAVDQAYAKGLTVWQHSVIRRYAKRNLNGRTDIVALAQAKEKIRELIQEGMVRNPKGTHAKQGRFLQGQVKQPTALDQPQLETEDRVLSVAAQAPRPQKESEDDDPLEMHIKPTPITAVKVTRTQPQNQTRGL